ncbi:hypothetical protein MUK42_10161 [Musa troglodytarum]|uniref:Uncharacterized protein n=1 Tax=Musa troglodytarum TaxID=320322 RepID=A0A9E7EC54_9LILI|nr:hypothetical protein MUK42_10161 [Musa troglodytarum]
MEFNIQLDHAHVVPVSVRCKFRSSLPTNPTSDEEELTNSFKQRSEEPTMKSIPVRACRILLIGVAILLCQFYSSEAHRGGVSFSIKLTSNDDQYMKKEHHTNLHRHHLFRHKQVDPKIIEQQDQSHSTKNLPDYRDIATITNTHVWK